MRGVQHWRARMVVVGVGVVACAGGTALGAFVSPTAGYSVSGRAFVSDPFIEMEDTALLTLSGSGLLGSATDSGVATARVEFGSPFVRERAEVTGAVSAMMTESLVRGLITVSGVQSGASAPGVFREASVQGVLSVRFAVTEAVEFRLSGIPSGLPRPGTTLSAVRFAEVRLLREDGEAVKRYTGLDYTRASDGGFDETGVLQPGSYVLEGEVDVRVQIFQANSGQTLLALAGMELVVVPAPGVMGVGVVGAVVAGGVAARRRRGA